MSSVVLEQIESSIKLGYERQDEKIIETATDSVFKNVFFAMLHIFSDKIISIKVDHYLFSVPKAYLFSEKHKKNLFKWLNRLRDVDHPATDAEFGKWKIDFEYWYYQLGGEKIQFTYHDDYLLTPQQAADALGVSKVTVNKYVKQGLEYVDNKSHNRIPKHAIEMMKDPIYGLRMQQIAQEKKLREQTPVGWDQQAREINQSVPFWLRNN